MRTANGQGHRGLAALAAGQVVFAAVFVFLLLSAFHQPVPHALPVGVVAAPAVTRQLQIALDAHEPGGVDLRSYPDAARARLEVIDGHIDGALVVAPGSLRLLTAGAGGIGPVQALTGAFDARRQVQCRTTESNSSSTDQEAKRDHDPTRDPATGTGQQPEHSQRHGGA